MYLCSISLQRKMPTTAHTLAAKSAMHAAARWLRRELGDGFTILRSGKGISVSTQTPFPGGRFFAWGELRGNGEGEKYNPPPEGCLACVYQDTPDPLHPIPR